MTGRRHKAIKHLHACVVRLTDGWAFFFLSSQSSQKEHKLNLKAWNSLDLMILKKWDIILENISQVSCQKKPPKHTNSLWQTAQNLKALIPKHAIRPLKNSASLKWVSQLDS